MTQANGQNGSRCRFTDSDHGLLGRAVSDFLFTLAKQGRDRQKSERSLDPLVRSSRMTRMRCNTGRLTWLVRTKGSGLRPQFW